MKKLFLTSIIAMGIVPTAFAVPSHTSGTFPGYMLEDYTYTNAATYANTGVYSGDVVANANYNDCPTNSWCDLSGQHACSTLSGGYNSSATGSSANTDCYRACNISNMGSGGSIASIAHATALTGNDYYGAGTDTCEPTECENGYHVKAGTPDLDPDIEPTDYTYSQISSGNGTWDVTAPYGHVTGIATCNTTSGSGATAYPQYNFEQGTEGQHCWCKMLSPARSAWVYRTDLSSAAGCAAGCANRCTIFVHGSAAFRSAMFGSVTPEPASCAITTYNCDAGTYLPRGTETCATCLENHYCPGGGYTYNTTNDGGITACPSGSYAPTGMSQAAQCGRILHIGNATMYLRTVKNTIPSLNFDINNDGVPDLFGNITTTETNISRGVSNKFKVSNGATTYYIYDDSIVPGQ